jgi:hypothetical protein
LKSSARERPLGAHINMLDKAMPNQIGPIDAAAAIFIYKADTTRQRAWNSVLGVVEDEGPIRGEMHRYRASFVNALSNWIGSASPSPSFLCIYAHMGPQGINCASGDSASRITWKELNEALGLNVGHLWLVGCNSNHALLATHEISASQILVTHASQYWGMLIEAFRDEISMTNIAMNDEIHDRIRMRIGDFFANHVSVYKGGSATQT